MQQSFNNYLNEALITFQGKAYPKFGHVLILAGGAGSGKGFVLNNLVGMQGRVLDVDEVKGMVMKSTMIANKLKRERGIDVKNLKLKNPKDVATLHVAVDDYLNLIDKREAALFKSVIAAPADRKPNLIFDVTLKNMKKFDKLAEQAAALGYDKKNIHLVWILNDVEVAKKQNKKRSRVVPEEILMQTHEGAAVTMMNLIGTMSNIRSKLDGDIYIAFNKAKVDAMYMSGEESKHGGAMVIDTRKLRGKAIPHKYGNLMVDVPFAKPNYVQVKKSGANLQSAEVLTNDIVKKIEQYVPKGSFQDTVVR